MKAKTIVIRARNLKSQSKDEVSFSFEDVELKDALRQVKEKLSMMMGRWEVVGVYVNGKRISLLNQYSRNNRKV